MSRLMDHWFPKGVSPAETERQRQELGARSSQWKLGKEAKCNIMSHIQEKHLAWQKEVWHCHCTQCHWSFDNSSVAASPLRMVATPDIKRISGAWKVLVLWNRSDEYSKEVIEQYCWMISMLVLVVKLLILSKETDAPTWRHCRVCVVRVAVTELPFPTTNVGRS